MVGKKTSVQPTGKPIKPVTVGWEIFFDLLVEVRLMASLCLGRGGFDLIYRDGEEGEWEVINSHASAMTVMEMTNRMGCEWVPSSFLFF